MNDPKIAEIRSWLSKASQDLDASAWLLESPQALYGVVGYHCQQAAEKTLKAFLTWHELEFEKTHSLVALVGLCLPISSDFEALRKAATTLTPFAVTTRYPGDLPEITQQEAQEALELARQVWNFILARLPEEIHLTKSTKS
jgi:HEPN domain-containing protein